IFGILCMLAGLGLVTLDRVPQTGAEWGSLGVRVSQYLFAMMGAMGLAFLIARYLPKMPYANRLILNAPADTTAGAGAVLPGAGARPVRPRLRPHSRRQLTRRHGLPDGRADPVHHRDHHADRGGPPPDRRNSGGRLVVVLRPGGGYHPGPGDDDGGGGGRGRA